MTLTQAQLDTLMQQLEGDAYRNPEQFRQRVFWLAVMGYGYILLVLSALSWVLVTIGLLQPGTVRYGSFWMGSAFVMALILLGILVRSLWVRFPKPRGRRLRRKEVPQLFALVDDLTRTLKTPKFHTILLTDEFNAGVVQIPRLGIFGWFQNYLLVGLPLMQALTLEQFQAVLAHELGHLSGQHSRFTGWIYHIRQAWIQLLERLQKHHEESRRGSGVWYIDTIMLLANGLGFLVFGWFFNWFVLRFTIHAFVLSRVNEYEADRCAASWAGGESTAAALVSIYIKRRYLDRVFWREIFQQVTSNATLPDPMSLMAEALKQPIAPEKLTRWLKASLAEKTTSADTHPCLTERLQALGYLDKIAAIAPQLVVRRSAAEALFDPACLEQVTDQANEAWKRSNARFWQGRANHLQDIAPKLQALQQKAATQTLSLEEQWNRCKWTADLQGDEAAIPLLRELLAEKSYHAPANYLLGRILLDQNDPKGIQFIENAVSCDPELTISGYELICNFLYYEQGDTDKLRHYHDEIEQSYFRSIFTSTGVYR